MLRNSYLVFSSSFLKFTPSLFAKGKVSYWHPFRRYGFIIEEKTKENLLVEDANLLFQDPSIQRNHRHLKKGQEVSFGIRSGFLFQSSSSNNDNNNRNQNRNKSQSRIPEAYRNMKCCVKVKSGDGSVGLPPHHFTKEELSVFERNNRRENKKNDNHNSNDSKKIFNKKMKMRLDRNQMMNRIKKFKSGGGTNKFESAYSTFYKELRENSNFASAGKNVGSVVDSLPSTVSSSSSSKATTLLKKDLHGFILGYPYSHGGFIRFISPQYLLVEDVYFDTHQDLFQNKETKHKPIEDATSASSAKNQNPSSVPSSPPPPLPSTRVIFDIIDDPVKEHAVRATNIRVFNQTENVKKDSSSFSALPKNVKGVVTNFFDRYGFVQPIIDVKNATDEIDPCLLQPLFVHITQAEGFQHMQHVNKKEAFLRFSENIGTTEHEIENDSENVAAPSKDSKLWPGEKVQFDIGESEKDGVKTLMCVNVKKI